MTRRLLFYISKLYSLPVVQPLVSEAELKDTEIALFVSSRVRRSIPESLAGISLFTELKDAVKFNPDFVLCPGNFVDFRLPGIKVELFHGIGIEKPSHYRIRHFFDLYLTSGPVVTERFLALEKRFRYFKTVETGWPKMDHVMAFNTDNLKERFSLPPDKKIILYAPTHSRAMESASKLVPWIERTIRKDEIWLCKPHEFMNREVLRKIAGEHFRIVNHYDITPYLHMADVMVSDTSSVVYEFMALDKPVVTFRTIKRKDKGINIEKPEELRAALDRSFASPEEFSAQRKKHLAEVNPRLDGTISRGIIKLLLSMDPSTPVGSRRKPVNLFRKMQILYHSRFRKGYLR